MKLELKEKLYYTRSSKGKIGFCREGNYTPEEYVKNCQKRGYDVIKADYKIIEILEVGDYVNGREIVDIFYDENDNVMDVCVLGSIVYDNNEIKSVITHEQMEQMAYKVVE